MPLGYPPLRRAIAAHLTARGLVTAEEEILVTGGAQQALSLLASYYVTPGAVILVEDPTFPGAIDAFRTAGGRILTVPVRQAGADAALLAATMSQAPVRAVSGGGPDVAWGGGPDQNWAGVTPASRAALSTRAGSARPS